jgi:ribonuclease VapC
MVVDTSAIVAILQEEPGFEVLLDKLADAPSRSITAVNYMEASIVLITLRGHLAESDLDSFLVDAAIHVIPISVTLAQLAREAFRLYGKGRHPAKLNLGDCFSYALAKQTGEPLLFKGNDFSRTDVRVA